jgi:hypothetical protein
MKVVTPGHKYELDHFESYGLPGCAVQTLQFIEKRQPTQEEINADLPSVMPGTGADIAYANRMRLVNDGTTNEEVLAVLIDRIQFLNSKFPCRENAIALTHIETALLWLNKRTADRKARGVEGKAEK